MAIADIITEIDNNRKRINKNITDSYTQAENKGATIPTVKNSENLPNTIASITGGGEPKVIIPKTITQNGVYNAIDDNADGYSPVSVDVPSGEWVRPADRPEVPVLNDNEIYYLFKVIPQGLNDMRVQFNHGSVFNGTIDWGDGNVYVSPYYGTQTDNTHVYNFDDIDVPINPDGSKWVWIKCYVKDTNITSININVRPSTRPTGSSSNIYIPNVYEMYVNAHVLTSFGFATNNFNRYSLCEILDIQNHSITSFGSFCYYWSNLRKVIINPKPAPSGGQSYFMNNCFSYDGDVPIDTQKITNFSQFFLNCLNMSNYDFDVSGLTGGGTNNPFWYETGVRKIKSIRMRNMSDAISTIMLLNTLLDRTAIINFLQDLPDRSSTVPATLNITNTPAASQLTADDIALFTAKNWNVVGWSGY